MGSGAMTVDEDWMRLRTRLVELVGVSGADILMDRPPGGWGDLVTNHTLDLRFAAWEERFAASEQRFDHKLDALGARGDRKFDAVLAEMRAGFAAIDLRFEMQRADLIGEMDRRFRNQAWMAISTIVAVGGVIVAAIRL
jgi:hypothetical protein